VQAVCSALLVAVLAAARWAGAFKVITLLRPVVLEPPGLAEAARALPERRLTPQEQEALARDGVLVVRSFIRDTQLLKDVLPALQQHQQYNSGTYLWSFLYNGVVRTLLREGPIGALAADAMQAEGVGLEGAPIWGRDGDDAVRSSEDAGWHQDGADKPDMMTMWIAVTHAPHAVEFVRGSHQLKGQILRECNSSKLMGAAGARIAGWKCVKEFNKRRLEPLVGSPVVLRPDLRPGDALLFNSGVLHRGRSWPRGRLAVAVRTRPEDPDACSWGGKACCKDNVIGHDLALYPKTPRNFRCLHERALPRPGWLWPRLDDRVPLGTPGPLLRLLAAVTHASFGKSRSLRSGVLWLSRFVPIL